MKQEVDTSIFWNLKRTLTYSDVLFYFIVGNRGGGKSYGFKEWAIDDFIKNGYQFGYIRRYKDDLVEPMKEFFKDIAHKYPDYEFKTEGRHFMIRLRPANPDEKWTDKDIAGYGFTLSTANNKKSIPYPNINKLCFDEFLLDDGNQRYLPREPIALLNLYETVARPGTGHVKVRCFLLANALSITNPYFIFFDLKLSDKKDKNGKYIWKHPDRPILVEDVRNEKFIKVKQESEFGSLVKGTSYAGYSIENKFLLDDDTFVEPKSPKARYYFTFIYMEHTLGVWVDFIEGKMYVSKQVDPSFPLTYSLTLKDHRPNTLFIKNKSRAGHYKAFLDAYKNGCVRFDSVNIKNITYDAIKLSLN